MTVFVVGNVTEDLVFRLPRLPREGETLIAEGRLADIGGKGLNQALILGRAGCSVDLVAPVGRDEAGRRAQALVESELPGTRLGIVEAPTDQSIIYVSASGENHIVSSAFAADSLMPGDVSGALSAAAPGDALVVQGNLSAETTRAALETARRRGVWTVANPSPIRWDWTALWPLIDLAAVNRQELAELSGEVETQRAIEVLRAAGLTEVLVTLGGQGAELHRAAGRVAVSAQAVRVVDTAGAGDTFCGTFVAARLAGREVEQALRAAARAAALTVSRSGTLSAFPDRAELAACLTGADI